MRTILALALAVELIVPQTRRAVQMIKDYRQFRKGEIVYADHGLAHDLALIASDGTEPEVPAGLGWEHVSVHAYRGTLERARQLRTPTWREMVFVKDLCWDGEDVVMQLHPRKSAYINNHPHVLHLWRSRDQAIPEPPSILVGI